MQVNIVIDNDILEKYKEYYFKTYPRRKKFPIKRPIPPSLNTFIAMKRMAQNSVKQHYKEFSIWLANYYKINNLNLTKCSITYSFYFKDKRRHDIDNNMITPKFINDGFTIAHVWVDDNSDYLQLIFNPIKIDKNNPRVEMLLDY